jgi:FixJ family two-component response regulator
MSRSGTVYVIDDDASVRRAMCRLLEVTGHAVVGLASAEEFLRLPETRRPLCLIVDVRMPGRTGFDLQDTLRADARALPIVFISGHGSPDLASRATAAGAVALLTKPVDEELLLSAIETGLDRDRARLKIVDGERESVRA